MSCRKTLKFFRILVRNLISKITSFNLEILKKLVKKNFLYRGVRRLRTVGDSVQRKYFTGRLMKVGLFLCRPAD